MRALNSVSVRPVAFRCNTSICQSLYDLKFSSADFVCFPQGCRVPAFVSITTMQLRPIRYFRRTTFLVSECVLFANDRVQQNKYERISHAVTSV